MRDGLLRQVARSKIGGDLFLRGAAAPKEPAPYAVVADEPDYLLDLGSQKPTASQCADTSSTTVSGSWKSCVTC
jgi:hypothetical protein